MSKDTLVPETFEVPLTLETDRFRLRMLSVDDVEKDYEAVVESRDLLHSMFGGPWPDEDFALSANLDDLRRHQREFLGREAFAYTVVEIIPDWIETGVDILQFDQPELNEIDYLSEHTGGKVHFEGPLNIQTTL